MQLPRLPKRGPKTPATAEGIEDKLNRLCQWVMDLERTAARLVARIEPFEDEAQIPKRPQFWGPDPCAKTVEGVARRLDRLDDWTMDIKYLLQLAESRLNEINNDAVAREDMRQWLVRKRPARD